MWGCFFIIVEDFQEKLKKNKNILQAVMNRFKAEICTIID